MANPYEQENILQEYLLFHFGSREKQMPWPNGPHEAVGFPQRCAELLLRHSKNKADHSRALDVGCAVGGGTFELSGGFSEVIGIDYSHLFIETARELARKGSKTYTYRETGSILHEGLAVIAPQLNRERVRFMQGDAQEIPPDIGTFDAIMACNLLCRLPEPDRFLARLPGLLNPDGILLITTPNTWLESFTAREYWIGATPETGEPFEALKKRLMPRFQLRERLDVPFLIREHYRKYQWSVAEATLWQHAPCQ